MTKETTRLLIGTALIAVAALIGNPAYSQTVTSPVKLVDSSPATAGMTLNRLASKVAPPQRVGTVVTSEPCGMDGALFVYGLGPTCPAATSLAPPRVTTPFEAGKPTASASRRSNLHIGRVLDGYVVNGAGLIEDVTIDLARNGSTMRRKDGSYGTATGLTFRRIDWTAGDAVIAIRGGSSDILIEDARLTCTGLSAGIPGGVKIGAANSPANHHITITRFAIAGCLSAPDRKGYRQGDGIATERPDHHIAITHGTIDATGGDSGLDIKSGDTTIDDVRIVGGSYSARLRSTGDVGALTIDSPRKAAIQIDGTTRRTIRHLILMGTLPAEADIVTNGAGGVLTIERCSRPVTTRIAKGTALVLGAGCKSGG